MLKTKSIEIGLVIIFIQLFTFSACQSERIDWEDSSFKLSVGGVQTDGNTEAALSELSYTLCLFRAPIDGENTPEDVDFKCIEIRKEMTKSDFESYSFKVNHSDKGLYAYRLFVHATPKVKAETVVNISDKESFDKLEISLIKEADTYVALSEDNYYDYQTISENDLSGTVIVALRLKRIVGRLVFDIFKSDPNLQPIDIDAGYGSTLDRVTQIDMLVKGITTKIKPSGKVVTKDADASVALNLKTKLDDQYRLNIAGQDPEYFATVNKKDTDGDVINGGVRLYSVYLLSTGDDDNNILKADLTFFYWDELKGSTKPSTKPSKKDMILHLPSSSPSSFLKIVENYYTLTNIRLKLNRIIDLDTSFEISIVTGWGDN